MRSGGWGKETISPVSNGQHQLACSWLPVSNFIFRCTHNNVDSLHVCIAVPQFRNHGNTLALCTDCTVCVWQSAGCMTYKTLGIFEMVIFKSSVLSYSFKLRGIDTDYLCELPKLASLKKSLLSVHVFWSIQHPNFPTF